MPPLENTAADAAPIETLRTALSDLIDLIASAKTQIVADDSELRSHKEIAIARDELSAVVEHTAEATDLILSTCEEMDDLADKLEGQDGIVNDLRACTARIFEACTFQDITAQRVKKVVGAVELIEQRLAAMLGDLNASMPVRAVKEDIADVNVPASLLNGPQLPGKAFDQSDVDLLFN